jgi:hypothetical protein
VIVGGFHVGLLAPGVGSTACEDINRLQSWPSLLVATNTGGVLGALLE